MTQKHYTRNEIDFYKVDAIDCCYCDKQLSTLNDFDFHLFIKHRKIWDRRCNTKDRNGST